MHVNVSMYICTPPSQEVGSKGHAQEGPHPTLPCCSTVHLLDKECHQPGTPI